MVGMCLYVCTTICIYNQFQAQLEDVIQNEESAQKLLESVTEKSRQTCQKCRELQAENKQLAEQLMKLIGLDDDNVALVNEMKAQVRRLEQEKESLQNEAQIAKTEVWMYRSFFCVHAWFP